MYRPLKYHSQKDGAELGILGGLERAIARGTALLTAVGAVFYLSGCKPKPPEPPFPASSADLRGRVVAADNGYVGINQPNGKVLYINPALFDGMDNEGYAWQEPNGRIDLKDQEAAAAWLSEDNRMPYCAAMRRVRSLDAMGSEGVNVLRTAAYDKGNRYGWELGRGNPHNVPDPPAFSSSNRTLSAASNSKGVGQGGTPPGHGGEIPGHGNNPDYTPPYQPPEPPF